MTRDYGRATPAADTPPQALGKAEMAANVLDCIDELVVYHDADLKVIWANKAAYDSLGLKPMEVIGSKCFTIWHRRSEPCEGCPLAKALLTGKPETAEIVRPGGEARFIRGYPVRELGGKIVSVVGVTMDITDLKRAEQDLRESEENFRKLVEQSLQGIIVIQDMRIVFANPVVAKISGYTIEEALSFSPEQVRNIIHPDDQEKVWGRYASRLSGEAVPNQYEFRGVRKDGTLWWAMMYSNTIMYKGKPAIQAVLIDITDHKKAERALCMSEEQHRSLVENINEIIFTLDTQGRFTYISPVVARLLGYDPNRIVGEPFNCFVHPDDAPGVLVAFERSVSGDSAPYEFRVVAEDGTTHYVRTSCRPLHDGDRLRGLTGIMADITETTMAGAVLKESEEMYETLVKTTTDAVVVTDLHGNITEVSSRALELLGYDTEAQIIGRSTFEFIAPRDHQRALSNLKRTMKNGFLRNREYTFVRNDGTQFIGELDAALIKDAFGNPKGLIATTRDITERKRVENALRRSEQRFKDLAETSSEWIWEMDNQGVFTYSNSAVESILGYGPEEILGRYLHDFVYPDDVERLKEATLSLANSNQPFRAVRHRIVARDGGVVWLCSSGVPVRDEQGALLGYRGTTAAASKQGETQSQKQNESAEVRA
jgi:PAS domain S-box-containing protein